MAAATTRCFLVRHGETEFNRLGVFRGRYEVDLNDAGRDQAREIGLALRGQGIETILAGPLSRAVETASIVGEVLGLKPEVDEAFNNIALGKWQGVAKDKIKEEFPEMWCLWTTEPEKLIIPGGETIAQVQERSFRGLKRVIRERGGTFAIVTHRSVIKTLAAAMLDVPAPYFWRFYIDNAAYSVFEHGESGFTLITWNNNAHLSRKVTEVF